MFVNGQGMRGGEFNDAFAEARFVGEFDTAPRYRFFSVRDEFPGLHPVESGGAAVPGEVYELPYLMLADRLLPREPAELELGIIELADGSGSLAMRMRAEALHRSDVEDISAVGGWRAHLQAKGLPFGAR
ncbi:gamma-glutamylcyclotransferase [Kineosporia sp. NBRC 101677]|nr:gamma-glutamylcyclotransferase [Kineosporia sp. NBRC 101677]